MSSLGTASALPLPITIPKFLPAPASERQQKNDQQPPIFSKRKLPIASCAGKYTHLTVNHNFLVYIVETPSRVSLCRFQLSNGALRAEPLAEIALEKYLAGYKISNIFVDVTGSHMLISLLPNSPGLSADFLYVHENGPRVRFMEKFKDHEITAVAFNRYNGTKTATGPILLGTSRGLIFETELTAEAEKLSYRKQIYDLGLGRPKYPITALEVWRLPDAKRYVVMAAAPDIIYTFHGVLRTPTLVSYVNGTQSQHTLSANTDWNYSMLRFHGPPNHKYPQHWAWLTSGGIRAGKITNEVIDESILHGEEQVDLGFDELKALSGDEKRLKLPNTFILTEYHVLLQYHDHIKAICLLNQTVVYEEHFHASMGKALSLVRDHFTGSIYLCTERQLFLVAVQKESRHIWRIYLDKDYFEMAEQHAQTESADVLDIVLYKKAEHAFENGQYAEAANIYADTSKSFEEVCLLFMPLADKRPIIQYVHKRLHLVRDSPPHVLALVIWLTDLYLAQINQPCTPSNERSLWQAEFDAFMLEPLVAATARENRSTIQQLIAQHADPHNLSQFAVANGDYEEVIRQQLRVEKYQEALETLRRHGKDVTLFYRYCPELIEHLPQQTVDVLIAEGRRLQIDQLVATLMAIDTPEQVQEIIRYLEYAVSSLGTTNQAVHNHLLHLYATHRPEKVIMYLKNEGYDATLVHYDLPYALGVCQQFDLPVATVFIQCLLKMWSSAVDLALTFDMALAKKTASQPLDEATRRKLWLRIAYHDIKGTDDVQKALSLLQECELLAIEDLLPFFSDFEKIDDFKKPICDALEKYNTNIQELQREMDECSKQADRVRDDLQSVRKRAVRIEAHATCTICESFLMQRPFFVFVCGHKFHSDCLERQVVPLLSSDRSRQLTALKQQLEALVTQSIAMADNSPQQRKRRETLKQEIEEILAADCYFCGLMIDTIDQPFVADWERANGDWD